MHQFFNHCPSYISAKECVQCIPDPHWHQIAYICDMHTAKSFAFSCNFHSTAVFLGKCTSEKQKNAKSIAKNVAMNNFKVRVIKQQWGIIKHQARPVHPPPQSRYQIDCNILFVIGRFLSRYLFSRVLSITRRKKRFLDIFCRVEWRARRTRKIQI